MKSAFAILSAFSFPLAYASVPSTPPDQPTMILCESIETLSSTPPLEIRVTTSTYGNHSWPVTVTLGLVGEPEKSTFSGRATVTPVGYDIFFGGYMSLSYDETTSSSKTALLRLSGVERGMVCF
jgi:hypothetical protein